MLKSLRRSRPSQTRERNRRFLPRFESLEDRVVLSWSDWAPLGGGVDMLVTAQNEDGRQELFGRGAYASLQHIWQNEPNGGWPDSWASLDGAGQDIAVGRNADGRLEVFVIGPDNQVWHRFQWWGEWSEWGSLGGDVRQIAVGQNQDRRLELFAIGREDYQLYHMWQSSEGWTDWNGLGGGVVQIAVGRNLDGRLEVFGIGAGWQVYHIWQLVPNGAWGDWSNLGGGAFQIVVGNNPQNGLELFALGGDYAVHRIGQLDPGGGWGSWQSLGGDARQIALGRNADGRLEVIALWSDSSVHTNFQWFTATGWSGWGSLGGAFLKYVAVGQNQDGRLEVYAITWNNDVFHKWQYTPEPPGDVFQIPWPSTCPCPLTQRFSGAHRGIDVGMVTGTPLYPVKPGVVVYGPPDPGGWGIYVNVQHDDGSITRYAHMSQSRVSVGQRVGYQTVLGLSGCTGHCTGPHLHLEYIPRGGITGQQVDPLSILPWWPGRR